MPNWFCCTAAARKTVCYMSGIAWPCRGHQWLMNPLVLRYQSVGSCPRRGFELMSLFLSCQFLLLPDWAPLLTQTWARICPAAPIRREKQFILIFIGKKFFLRFNLQLESRKFCIFLNFKKNISNLVEIDRTIFAERLISVSQAILRLFGWKVTCYQRFKFFFFFGVYNFLFLSVRIKKISKSYLL